MKNIVIIGCGKGIGLATAKILAEQHKIIGISRTENHELNHPNIEFHTMDILSGNLVLKLWTDWFMHREALI
ncbi:hypothetical protein [Chryseobacterium taihuense]|uniref:Short chain dehydrogenase n=1 Tax=Chryseobacterium taihuense TaxID=1141221 RepID=A0ABY0QPQ4_9FLAO|nr:hypothetical protein [Chryseobacterium taihuense]SDL44720.1 hypothetical protein SAMN05216273_101205 [Chryseobacterium taihuense]